jgi:hypothetical protein
MIFKSDIEKSENSTYKKSMAGTALSLGVKTATGLGLSAALGHLPTGIKREDLNYVKHFSINGKPWYEAGKFHTKSASARELVWNSIKATEEMLFGIPRAFSGSALYGRGILKNLEVPLKGNALADQLEYLNKISGGRIDKSVLEHGLLYKPNQSRRFNGGGSLFRMNAQGEAGEALLNNAYLYPGYWNPGVKRDGKSLGFTPRWPRALYQQHGFKPPKSEFFITGGNTFVKAAGEHLNAFATVAAQNYVKLLDDPFELASKQFERLFGKSNTLTRAFGSGSQILEKLMLRNQFGVGGKQFMKGDALQLLKRHTLRGLPKFAAIVGAFKLADTALRTTPIVKHTGLGLGIKGIVAKGYQGISGAYSRVSDLTGMTYLSKKQEEKAPGSTSLLGLASFPMSAAIFGGTVGKLTDLVQKTPVGHKGPAPKLFSNMLNYMETKSPVLKGIVGKTNARNYGRVGAFASMAAIAATALVAPFIPGALGSSKSHEELKDIYTGRERVPIRRGRFWEMGTTPISGSDIEAMAPHWTVRAMTDGAKKGRLPEEYYNNPLRYAIARLIDPYAVERKLDKERPYTFWGPTDYGMGIAEKIFAPLKEAWKPTIMAHPEGLSGIHPSAMKRSYKEVPTSLDGTVDGISTSGYAADPTRPNSLRSYLSQTAGSIKDVFGLHGFALSGVFEGLTGGQSFLTPNAVHESSGRILSAQRAYWDQAIGGAFGNTEAYRRLNPDREYSTEYVSSPIRNQMPEWIPDGGLRYGDPYAQMKMGELRLPGRGYASLFPELKHVESEQYPAVHKLNILSDVAPTSAEFYHQRNLVEQQISEGRLNSEGIDLYQRAVRQRETKLNEDRFDYGDGAIGGYYLALKKAGRALPTESLYPVSPVHKLAGPADPLTEYKSFELLDKPFKLWQNPYSDFLKPAINRTINNLSLVPFVPGETRQKAGLNSYFSGMQYVKNQYLQERAENASASGDYAAASYFQSGKRPTIYGENPYGNVDELISMMPQTQQKYATAFSYVNNPEYQKKILGSVTPEMQQTLSAYWNKSSLMAQRDFDTIELIKENAKPIQGTSEELVMGSNTPGRDFIGWAPGVDLNAMKVKTVNRMGKNLRDFNLWREDERQAVILDAVTGAGSDSGITQAYSTGDRDAMRKQVDSYLRRIGMRGAHVSVTPVAGRSRANLQLQGNNESQIRSTMRDEGWISN